MPQFSGTSCWPAGNRSVDSPFPLAGSSDRPPMVLAERSLPERKHTRNTCCAPVPPPLNLRTESSQPCRRPDCIRRLGQCQRGMGQSKPSPTCCSPRQSKLRDLKQMVHSELSAAHRSLSSELTPHHHGSQELSEAAAVLGTLECRFAGQVALVEVMPRLQRRRSESVSGAKPSTGLGATVSVAVLVPGCCLFKRGEAMRSEATPSARSEAAAMAATCTLQKPHSLPAVFMRSPSLRILQDFRGTDQLCTTQALAFRSSPPRIAHFAQIGAQDIHGPGR